MDAAMKDKLRRQFVRNAGIGVMSLGTFGTVVTAQEDGRQGTVRAAKNLIRQEKYEKAQDLLEKKGINHSFSVLHPYASSSGVTIQNGRYVSPSTDDTTELFMGIIENSSSNYDVLNHWHLYEEGNVLTPDNVCPPDGAAIFWNEDHWQPTSIGRSNFSSDYDYVEYGDYSADGGILAEVDVPAPESDNSRDTLIGDFEIELESVSDRPEDFPVKGTYTHTWINTSTKTCSGLTAGVSLGAGSITVEGDVQDWSMADQVSL